jgi:hypothetical protein
VKYITLFENTWMQGSIYWKTPSSAGGRIAADVILGKNKKRGRVEEGKCKEIGRNGKKKKERRKKEKRGSERVK